MKCLPCKVISVVIQHHCSAWRRENLPEHIRSDQNTWFLRQQPKCPATPESIFSCFKIAIPYARISPKCQCTEHSSFCRHPVQVQRRLFLKVKIKRANWPDKGQLALSSKIETFYCCFTATKDCSPQKSQNYRLLPFALIPTRCWASYLTDFAS